MKAIVCFCTGLGALAVASWGLFGQPPNQPNPEEGVEVLARGPIHEAFAQPNEPVQAPSPPIAKKPPEPIEELPPEEKPDLDDVLWVPGYWAWDEDRDGFLWVSGIWRTPVPERRWIPGYWHEANGGWQWVSGFWGPIAETIEVYSAPPEPIEEAIAPPVNADSIYVPGIWIHRETRFWWRPGHWIAVRPGWVWTPARYCWTPAGYCFVNGCWDYDLHHRGMCFAPVYIDVRIAQRPNWFYRPRHIVRTDFLLGSLFVNLSRHHYAFGDYYDAGYARRGYVPWVDYRVRKTSYDPLFSYYRWQNRAQPRWEADLRASFVDRRDNQDARPARTFAQQEKAPGKNKLMAVATLEQAKTSGVKLTTVNKTQITEIQKQVAEVRKITTTRRTIETSAKATAKKAAGAAPITLELPKTTFKTPTAKKTPPPQPETPKVQGTPKDKAPKDGFPKDKVGKDKSPKDKIKDDPFKDKNPKDKIKDDPFKDKSPKDKLPKDFPNKDKFSKDDPFKDKLPKDIPRDKLPKIDPFKGKLPKDTSIKDKNPMDGPAKDKSPKKDDSPKEKKSKDKDNTAELNRGDGSSTALHASISTLTCGLIMKRHESPTERRSALASA